MTAIDAFDTPGYARPSRTKGAGKGGTGDADANLFPMRGRVIMGSVFAVLLLGGIGGWSTTATLSGAVIGAGTVRVVDDLKTVQHVDGGIVREIAVQEGDAVRTGDLLLRLDDVQIRAERGIVISQMAELLAREARLMAERDGAASLAFADAYLDAYPGAAAIANEESQLFAGNLESRLSQESQLAQQISQLDQELSGLAFQKTALEAELALVLEDRVRIASLVTRELMETSRLSELDRDIARIRGQIGEVDANLGRARSRISETEIGIAALGQTAQTNAQRELRDVGATLGELRERLAAIDDRLARTEILAPVDGIVNELAVTTLGGVITPAQNLVTIVPENADLRVQFQLATKDIDQIAIGQDTTLRFSAFNQRTTPEVKGEVSHISAAAQSNPQTGETFYLAEITVTDDIAFLGDRGLVPGMPVEVFVQTEQQTAIAYFLRPFTDQITRAFREE